MVSYTTNSCSEVSDHYQQDKNYINSSDNNVLHFVSLCGTHDEHGRRKNQEEEEFQPHSEKLMLLTKMLVSMRTTVTILLFFLLLHLNNANYYKNHLSQVSQHFATQENLGYLEGRVKQNEDQTIDVVKTVTTNTPCPHFSPLQMPPPPHHQYGWIFINRGGKYEQKMLKEDKPFFNSEIVEPYRSPAFDNPIHCVNSSENDLVLPASKPQQFIEPDKTAFNSDDIVDLKIAKKEEVKLSPCARKISENEVVSHSTRNIIIKQIPGLHTFLSTSYQVSFHYNFVNKILRVKKTFSQKFQDFRFFKTINQETPHHPPTLPPKHITPTPPPPLLSLT